MSAEVAAATPSPIAEVVQLPGTTTPEIVAPEIKPIIIDKAKLSKGINPWLIIGVVVAVGIVGYIIYKRAKKAE